jgi:hypothetical protein
VAGATIKKRNHHIGVEQSQRWRYQQRWVCYMERWNNVQRLYGRSDASMRTNHRWMRYNRSEHETGNLSCFVVEVTKVIKESVKTKYNPNSGTKEEIYTEPYVAK